MYKLVIFTYVIILSGVNSLQISDFKNQDILKYADDCSKLFEVDLNELKNIEENNQEAFDKNFKNSYEYRCFARCVIVRMNLLNQGGNISLVKTYERFPEVDLKIIIKVMGKCSEENNQENNCDRLEANDRCICYHLNKIKNKTSNDLNNTIE